MKISVYPRNDRSWDETLALARWAESAGLDGFWYADHLLRSQTGDTPEDGPAHECWTVLTALGALVPRLRLVSMVSPVSIHHPVVLAKRAATLDSIAPGRVVLGLGAGWQVNEHETYGFGLPEPGKRVSRFAEAVEVVRLLFTQDRSQFHGEYYTLNDAPFDPRPNGPPSLLVGSNSPRMLRLTARFADEWNTSGDPDLLRVRTASFMRACDDEGRDPSKIRRSTLAMIFLTKDDTSRARIKSFAPAGRSLIGGPNELVEVMSKYLLQGVDEFAVPDLTLGETPEARRESLEVLRTEVFSHLM